MTAVTTLPMALDGWTVDDLAGLSDEDAKRCELVDGALLLMAPPGLRHGYSQVGLVVALTAAVPPHLCVVVESELRFDRRNVRLPDVAVVRRSALAREFASPGDVLLAVEVMGRGSIANDRVAKPAQYAAAGIPAFWRLELSERVLVTHVLDGEVYRETGRWTGAAVVDEPFRVELEVTALLT